GPAGPRAGRGGLFQGGLGRSVAAGSAFHRAAQLDADDVASAEKLVRLQLKRGAWNEAAPVLTRLVPKVPPEAGAALLRATADLAANAGDATAALALRRQAHGLVPASGRALATLALSLYAAGASAEALQLLAALTSSLDLDADPTLTSQVLLAHADLLESAREVPAAEGVLQKLVERSFAPESAVERLAELRGRSDPRAAVALLTDYQLGRPPSEHTGRALLALASRARAELADPDLADRLLVRAAAMLTEPLEAHRARVELHRETGRTSALIEALRAVAERSVALGDTAGAAEALTALEATASSADRTEDALAAMAQLRSTLETAGRLPEAGAAERRRADLLL